MFLPVLTALTISTASASAALDTTVSLPADMDVYVDETVTVSVDNTGSRHAQDVELTIQLPETATSPSVHVLGILGAVDADCTESGTTLVCDLGRVRRGRSKSVTFDIALPVSTAPLGFTATASGSNAAASSDTDYASVVYVDTAVAGPRDIANQHCTGIGLTAFYECTLFPSSISGHSATLESNGDVSFASQPGYAGSWGQASPDSLWFEYTQNGTVVAEFEGYGVGGDCFEGLTTFPGSSYVAPYEVCLD